MLKYFIEYNNINDDLIRCEIESDEYEGSSTEIFGKCTLEYIEEDDILEPIKGSGLRIDLEASIEVDLIDLWTENERVYKTTLYRNGQVLFIGFIDPEGVFQDYTTLKWIISIDCVGGLGYLENLAYIGDNEVSFFGRDSVIKIISNCLKRTGINANINVLVDIYYQGLDPSKIPFNEVQMNQDRYVKEDEETNMDCEEVLTSILSVFGCCICQHLGEWFIYRPYNNLSFDVNEFDVFDFNGVSLATKRTVYLNYSVGSEINDNAIFWVNSNQSIRMKNSIGAQKINYKYGLDDFITDNPNFTNDGLTISSWDINNSVGLTLEADGTGVAMDVFSSANISSNPTTLSAGDALKLIIKAQQIDVPYPLPEDDPYAESFYKFRVIHTNGTTTNYLKEFDNENNIFTTEWVATVEECEFYVNRGVRTVEWQLTIPFNGTTTIEIISGTQQYSQGAIRSVSVGLKTVSDNVIKGEFHTSQRVGAISSKVDEVKEVFNGDNNTSIYFGTIYKSDGLELTSIWNRLGVDETFPLLRILSEEYLRLNAKPRKVFSGDLKGYIPFFSKIAIENVSGLFIPLRHSYDTMNDVTSFKLSEYFIDELEDMVYDFALDVGETVKPTIV